MARSKNSMTSIWLAAGAVGFVFLSLGLFLLWGVRSEDSQKRQRKVQMVQLVKPPPPPPKIKEEPPEQQVVKEEDPLSQPEIENLESEPDQGEDESQDNGPSDDNLGLDADGSAGSDGFGLHAKKGGAPLLGSGGSSLLRQHRWYVQIVQDEIRTRIRECLDKKGGIPDEKLVTLVRLVLDRESRIKTFSIMGSSGNQKMDQAVIEAIESIQKFSEPLPSDLQDASLEIKVSLKG